jgi:hypothetical protein
MDGHQIKVIIKKDKIKKQNDFKQQNSKLTPRQVIMINVNILTAFWEEA